MNIIDYVLRSLAFMALSFSLFQNYTTTIQKNEKEELLAVHLSRIKKENDNIEKAVLNGAKIQASYRCNVAKFLNNEGQLDPEYKFNVDSTLGTIKSLEGEHQRGKVLNEPLRELFSHTSLFIDPDLFKKSIIDNRVHFGQFESLYLSGKYDIYINGLTPSFNYFDEYVALCKDTMKFRIDIIKINNETFDIDTTILSETLILNQNIK
ncbi:MAG TPA: hypothetical protein VFG10_07975 [Saprospiraceae bacterium]|nr:hypothetical protein [Saprospiraceae bacterium]